MSRLRILTALTAMGLCSAVAVAQFDTDHPGYFPIEDLGIVPEESINLEINLTGPMLKFIALAVDEEEPDFARLVEGLKSIRVRGADLEGIDLEEARVQMRSAGQRLAEGGWISMVRIRDDEEEIYIYFKEQDGEMVGLTVLSVEDEEAMLINLVGTIDPSGLGSLAEGLDLPQLEEVLESTGESD